MRKRTTVRACLLGFIAVLGLAPGIASADALDALQAKGITQEKVGPTVWGQLGGKFYGSPSQTFQLYFSVVDPATKVRVKEAMACLQRFGGSTTGPTVGDALLKGLDCSDDNRPGKNSSTLADAEVKPNKTNAKDIAAAKGRFNENPGVFIDAVLGQNAFRYWGAIKDGSIQNYPQAAGIVMAQAGANDVIDRALSDAKANRWGCKLMTPNGVPTGGGLIYCLPASLWSHVTVRQ
jgi:hypothetical protein